MIDVDKLAQEIRRVDGNHDKGAGALAEALMPFLTAALSHADHWGVKVAALEWEKRGYSLHARDQFYAHTIVGTYAITDLTNLGWFEWLNKSGGTVGKAGTLEAAKRAAQSDYEARILAALTQAPAPTLTGEVEKSRKLEVCIDCGDPIVKPSPIRGRLCACRNAESE